MEYAKVGNVSRAAQLIGVNRRTHYEWLELDAEYAAQFKDAEAEFADLVRETLRERALLGQQHEIWFKGTMVGYRTEYSERLLELLARAKCPEFREKHEITGPNGEAVKIQVVTGVPQPE